MPYLIGYISIILVLITQISSPQPCLSIFIPWSDIPKHYQGQSTFSPFSVPLSGKSWEKKKKLRVSSQLKTKILNNSIKAVSLADWNIKETEIFRITVEAIKLYFKYFSEEFSNQNAFNLLALSTKYKILNVSKEKGFHFVSLGENLVFQLFPIWQPAIIANY